MSGQAMSQDSGKVKLLHGPYRAPALRLGERATCLYRDCDVIVTGWTDAPIPWPLGKRAESMGRSSLVVDEELARAIRSESALALKHHWGVGTKMVWKWRQAFDVSQFGTEGSRRLQQAVNPARVEALRRKDWSPHREAQRRRSLDLNLGANIPRGVHHGAAWSAEDLALLGTDTDEAIAARTGKSRSAVRTERWRRKISPKR